MSRFASHSHGRLGASGALILSLCSLMLVSAGLGKVYAQTPIYVDGSLGSDGNNGLTPATAKQTIQAGVTAVAVSGTVIVAPSTYAENVTINKNLTLLSTGGRAVTTVTGISNGALGAILVTNNTSGVQIGAVGQGFTINGIDNPSPGIESSAVYFQGNHSGAQVIDNEIVAAGDAALMTEFGTTISGFSITGNTFSGQTFIGPNPADNGFANQFTTPNVPRQLVVMGCGTGCATTSSITFSGNQITGTAGGYNTLAQEQGNNLVTIDGTTVLISGNSFTGTTTRFATSLRGRGPATTISGNTFSSAGLTPTAGHVFIQNTGSSVATVATSNSFDKGVYVDGPIGTIGHRIQPAVAVVPASTTIRVLPGTYEEQVVFTTANLTLQGAGVGSTIIKSPVSLTAFFVTGGPNNNYPVVFVNGAGNTIIRDVTVDGFGRGNGNYRFQGVGFWNAGGKLLNAEVKRIEETPFNGNQHGVAVYANNNTGGPYSLEVGNVTMTDFQKNGTVFNGNGLTINVHDCSVTGKGPTVLTAQNGIQVSNGTGGSIANVAVSGVFYSPATNTACGLLNFAGTTVNLTGSNSFTGCQTGLYYQETNGAVSGTSVSGSTWAATLYNTLGTFKASSSGSRPAVSPIDGETAAARQPGIASLFNVTLSNGCLLGSDTAGSSGVYAYSAGGGLSVGVTNMEIKDWDAAIVAEGAAVSITANDNAITSNVTAGFDNTLSLAAQDAELNWWGAAGGPAGGNAVLGSGVDYTPWRTTGADLNAGCGFQATADNVITPVSPGTCISTVNPCVTVPMNIARTTSDHIRGYSVTFTLSPQLMLCSGLASITEGTYLSAISTTNFQVLNNGGGSYTADCAILGLPCGATAATGNLFNVAVKNSGADGTGTITVTSVIARDCDNGPVAVSPGAPLSITIDNTVPTAVANLAAAQKKTLNDADGTTKIQLTFTPPGDAATVEVYRAGFRFYPEYDDAGGAVPTTPTYPPGAPWVLTGVTASLQYDEVATPRDFWYYVVFTKDACGNVSAVSNKTTGTLNYHLGDVSDGITAGVGNNVVNTADISLLGAHYGITLVFNDLYNYLDVGPTTDFSVNARPTTDNQVQFEDLILFAINYGQVSKVRRTPAPARSDQLIVLVPENVEPGGTLVAHLWAQGTGRVQGLSARLAWNAAVVEPIGIESGAFLRDQDGVAFSPAAGTIDVALLGKRDVGLSGEGDLATVRFRVVGSGDPGIGIAQVDARDATNQKIDLATSSGGDGPQHAVPRVTSLLANVPNPFNPTTKIPFTLAVGGPVELAIYTVDGRKVRSLLRDVREPGLYEVTWDGQDANGVRAASGTYYARLVAIDGTRSRTLVLLK